ncbi:hypothetical protein OXPF_20130 [Oxobacter pfennigii]|uniref:Uncharacterized protein n=1 Tax=Oxobacter pfennigii TaxID=36849 RepID=A0A0P9AG68_9CLOT|nr:hypothetical protein [Oxobacter pfennigii]KPU44394.1 hypothetical protein OXPF_20130 [Oxobacter pfennigii]
MKKITRIAAVLSMILLLVSAGCTGQPAGNSPDKSKFKAGTYTASAMGIGGA